MHPEKACSLFFGVQYIRIWLTVWLVWGPKIITNRFGTGNVVIFPAVISPTAVQASEPIDVGEGALHSFITGDFSTSN